MRDVPMVAGEPAHERLMRVLDYRLAPNTQPLDEAQVAVVLRALADHTAIAQMIQYDPDPERMPTPWPEVTAIGRWLHAVADQLDRA